MRQGGMQRWGLAALACMLIAAAPAAGYAKAREGAAHVASVTRASKSDGSTRTKRANAMRQFSGYVSAIDKTSITVEKHGKNPETRVFTKLDEMHTTGDVEKDARVTVYYREEGGKAVAHRVVVKPARSSSKNRG